MVISVPSLTSIHKDLDLVSSELDGPDSHEIDCKGCGKPEPFFEHEAMCQGCSKKIKIPSHVALEGYFQQPYCRGNDACKAKASFKLSAMEEKAPQTDKFKSVRSFTEKMYRTALKDFENL